MLFNKLDSLPDSPETGITDPKTRARARWFLELLPESVAEQTYVGTTPGERVLLTREAGDRRVEARISAEDQEILTVYPDGPAVLATGLSLREVAELFSARRPND